MTDQIQLTVDPIQQAKLRRKLEEYRSRIAAKAPTIDVDSTYKAYVLAALLEKGSIDPQSLIAEMQSLPGASIALVWNAIRVIASYNANEVGRTYSGTGLQ